MTDLFAVDSTQAAQIAIDEKFQRARRKKGDLFAAQTYPDHPDAAGILQRFADNPGGDDHFMETASC